MKQTKKEYEEKQFRYIQSLKHEIKDLRELNLDLQLELHKYKEWGLLTMKYREEIKKRFIISNICILIIYICCNWIMDISSWIHAPNCATNGFIVNCSNILMYHVAWYISIVITIYFAISFIVSIIYFQQSKCI